MGFSVSRQPTYMYQSPSGYIFRLRIPNDLKHVVGKCEFRYSLRAGALRVAKHRAMFIASFIHQLFIKVRSNMSDFTPEGISKLVKQHIKTVIKDDEVCNNMPAKVSPGSIIVYGETVMEAPGLEECDNSAVLTTERINQMVQKYIRNTLDNDEKCRAIGGTVETDAITLDGMSLLESSNMNAEESQSLLKSVTKWLQLADHSLMFPVTDRILRNEGVIVGTESVTYHTLSRELMKAFQSVLNVRMKRSTGDYSEPDSLLIPSLSQQPQVIVERLDAKAEKVVTSVRFLEVQESYLKEIEKANSWTEKTMAENLSIFALFVRVMGDMDIEKINRKRIASYKETLMRLPPNLNKNRLYKDLSIVDILALKPETTISVNTINKYLRRLSGLFNYAVRNGLITLNPAEGIQLKSQKRPDQECQKYTKEDLKKLFTAKEYLNGTHRQSYGFWAPLIALYTGCRLEEICQLHLEDIRQEEGIWVFDINTKKEKRLKTLSSERLIPIHSDLFSLGLIEHVETLKDKKELRLFPELRKTRDGYGQVVSKWFQRYKERFGFGKGKTFHSFRHTFITYLKHNKVEPIMINELDGHTIGSELSRYGKRYTPEILQKEAIEKIDYGLDLDMLVKS